MPKLCDTLRLLSDDKRLRILHLLSQEPLTVAELQELLGLSQSSVSSHLGKLKRAGFLHDVAEGSAHRYRLREDLQEDQGRCWQALADMSRSSPEIAADQQRLQELRSRRGRSWVEQVAGQLHREYAPGRTWEALGHSFLAALDLGDCVDVGAGDGTMIELLLGSCRSLTCVDPSPAMVAAAQQRIQGQSWQQRVRYCQAPAEALPLDDASYDTVLFLQSLQYMQDPQRALQEAQRILRPRGLLICLSLATHQHAECERYGHRHRGFSCQQLRAWTAACVQHRCLTLAAESRPPRFTPILLTVRKEAP